MDTRSDYYKTIVLYCRDFLESASAFSSLHSENFRLENIIGRCMEEDRIDISGIIKIEGILAQYVSKLLIMYSKNPDNYTLDSLYRRAQSLQDMCVNELNAPPFS